MWFSLMGDYKSVAFLIFIVFSCLALGSCGDSEQMVKKEKDWVKEEILEQLTELRKDVKSLKSDIAKVNEKLSTIGKGQRPKAKAPKEVKLNLGVTTGNKNAKIAIVEFTDYQCPFCARHAKKVLPQIKNEMINTGKVKYVSYDFPLSFHKQAKSASVAARCADKQKKFWGMHDAIFNNPRNLNNKFYTKTAIKLNMNAVAFKKCLKDTNIAKAVEANIEYGNSLGVTGTPKFYVGKINGITIKQVTVISGAQRYAAFKRAIDALNK